MCSRDGDDMRLGDSGADIPLDAAAGRPEPGWTDAVPVRGATPIRAVHLLELRAAVRALE